MATKFQRSALKTLARLSLLTLLLAILSAGCGGGNNGPNTQPVIGLWEANLTNVLEFLSTHIAKHGDSAPTLIGNLPAPGFGAPQGVTFDSSGNLWVLDG